MQNRYNIFYIVPGHCKKWCTCPEVVAYFVLEVFLAEGQVVL